MYEDDAESALHYRASAFATDPTQSPYLHSGIMYGVPVLPGTPSIQVPAPAHLYGATGPLEVKNGMPENGEEDASPKEGVIGTPRFLGLDGESFFDCAKTRARVGRALVKTDVQVGTCRIGY